jgi:hypothetical protein
MNALRGKDMIKKEQLQKSLPSIDFFKKHFFKKENGA